MPPASASRPNLVAAQEPYAYGYPADPYYVVLPPAPHLRNRRRRRLRLLAYAATLVICLGLFLGAAFYFCWPSRPSLQVVHVQFNNINFQTVPQPGSDVPYLFMNINMASFVKIKNMDYFSLGYDSLDIGLGYRGRTIGVVQSEGGRLPARSTVYVNSTLELNGTEVLHDVMNLLEDLARKELPLDTVAEFNGRAQLLFAKISLKVEKSYCNGAVNHKDNHATDCYPCADSAAKHRYSGKTTPLGITRWWSVRGQAFTLARCLWVLGRSHVSLRLRKTSS